MPAFNLGNHTIVIPDRQLLPWLSHTTWLDFELELGFVLPAEVNDADAAREQAATGDFALRNDWPAQGVQVYEYRHGLSAGPAVNTSKSFATSLGPIVVTGDELISRARALAATVRVSGETWSHTSTAGAVESLGDPIGHASTGERAWVAALRRGRGLELNRRVAPRSSSSSKSKRWAWCA
jgi:2-keto-4-pentenoate hydratase/2-oxohepta-3-ene-1,7-dioic acid hydratase in catechol pathway